MAELYKYTCPSCGANIDPTGAGKVVTCAFCGSVFDRTEILNAYDRMTADKNAAAVKKYKADLAQCKALNAKTTRLADEVTELTKKPTEMPLWAMLLTPAQILWCALMLVMIFAAYKSDNKPMMITAVLLFAPLMLALIFAGVKKKRLAREAGETRAQLKAKLAELESARKELEAFTKEFSADMIPPAYRSDDTLDYIIGLFSSYQAIQLGDALKLCDERSHFKRMEDLQKQQVDIQKKQLEIMDQLADYDFDDTYDDDDFTLHETLKAFNNKQ